MNDVLKDRFRGNKLTKDMQAIISQAFWPDDEVAQISAEEIEKLAKEEAIPIMKQAKILV